MSKKERDAARLQLVKEGLSTYLDALWAIREFHGEIIKQTKEVVNKRLDDLSDAMKVSLKGKSINTEINPNFNEDNFGNEAYLGCSINVFESGQGLYSLHFGLSFERSDSQNKQFVYVTMYTAKAPQRDFLLKQCKKISENFDNWENYEIGLADYSVKADNFDLFEEKLNGLIDNWIKVWKNIKGGVNSLPQ